MEPHHRHHHPSVNPLPHSTQQNEASPLVRPSAPYLVKHFSMDDIKEHEFPLKRAMVLSWIYGAGVATVLVLILGTVISQQYGGRPTSTMIPIEQAQPAMLDVGDGIRIWYRTWGTRSTGIPVLFVHGGPGNAIADYHDGNKRFFDPRVFFVVEIDQRGTGNSQPSVRDDWRNMKYYPDISIDQISADFERIREELQIDKWLVWGGSFGSTISINYGTRYPERCLALVLRGIYLDTKAEVKTVYSRETYLHNPKRLGEFDILFNYAANNITATEEPPLDPNDAHRLLLIYERMILSGDRYAIWHWHVFENNLMEQDPANLFDPHVIAKEEYPSAISLAYFETRLWLRGSYEAPSNLMDRILQLETIPIWVCQGNFDEVCPPQYARRFVNALSPYNPTIYDRFLQAGHEDTDPVMAQCLREAAKEFVATMHRSVK